MLGTKCWVPFPAEQQERKEGRTGDEREVEAKGDKSSYAALRIWGLCFIRENRVEEGGVETETSPTCKCTHTHTRTDVHTHRVKMKKNTWE